jgi:heptaprenyl diphosphate synthase
MVFQLADDALDLVGTEDSLGKPAGSDIREGTFTLPVLSAVQSAEDGTRLRQLLSSPRPYADETVEEALFLLRRGGWVDRAIDAALERVEAAQTQLTRLPDRPALPVLEGLGRYLVARVESERGRA